MLKQVLQRIIDFMHGEDKDATALSNDDLYGLTKITTEYKTATGETHQYQPYEKIEDANDLIDAVCKTLGINFSAESMRMLTYINPNIVTTNSVNEGVSFDKQGNTRIGGELPSLTETLRGGIEPLLFDTNLGFQVEIWRLYSIYQQQDSGREYVRGYKAGDNARELSEEFHGQIGHSSLTDSSAIVDRELKFKIRMIKGGPEKRKEGDVSRYFFKD